MSDLFKKMQKKKLEEEKMMKEEDEGDIEEEEKDTIAPTPYTKPVPVEINHALPPMTQSSKGAPKSTQQGGAGYSPIPWENYYDKMDRLSNGATIFWAGSKGPLYFCIHGAGHSALSFALTAKEVRKFGMLVAYDIKGHGMSEYTSDKDDYSEATLLKEAEWVLSQVAERWKEPTITIVGHSLGGALASKLANKISHQKEYDNRLVALLVIDVVEGSAIDSLGVMEAIINSRPKTFPSEEKAIEWMLKSRTVKCRESARVSVPSLIKEKKVEEGELKTYEWKCDLIKTQPFWMDWFKGMNKAFLDVKLPKILCLAAADRMDTEMTIAQMQGKFKIVVVNNVGHVIQEDSPKEIAKVMNQLIVGFKQPANIEEMVEYQKKGPAFFHPTVKAYIP